MEYKICEMINKAVLNMINHTSSDATIRRLIKKHEPKIHFIPTRYRVLGGILQSMNIQFGNFIEELMSVIVSNDERYRIINKYSGKKSNSFKISRQNDE